MIQKYAWGKIGLDSEVAKLVVSGDPSAVIEDGEPYAEVISLQINNYPVPPGNIPISRLMDMSCQWNNVRALPVNGLLIHVHTQSPTGSSEFLALSVVLYLSPGSSYPV